jgi:heterodisulfide reductase subunit C
MTPVTHQAATAPEEAVVCSRIIEIESIAGGLAGDVQAASGALPMTCYQCTKCSCGCPVADRGDLKPHELVRLVQTDQRAAVLGSRFIWACTSCHTCVTRCPQKVDIPAMNDALRVISLREGLAVAGTAVPVFNEVFLAAVRKRGRVHEITLMAAFKLRTRRFMEDIGKAPAMTAKGKLPLRGSRVRGRSEREEMFRRAVAAAAGQSGAGQAAAAKQAVAERSPAAATKQEGDA